MAITHTMTNSVKSMKDSNNTKTNQKSKIRMSAGDRAVEVICYIIFAIAAFLCLYPFYYIVINTISANDISARGDILFVPQQIHFHNYISAFRICQYTGARPRLVRMDGKRSCNLYRRRRRNQIMQQM